MPPRPTDRDNDRKSNRYYLIKYGSFAFQLLAILVLVIFLGITLDKKIGSNFLLFSWLFPLLVILGMIVKVLKDTAQKK
jgi:hypothetical protein